MYLYNYGRDNISCSSPVCLVQVVYSSECLLLLHVQDMFKMHLEFERFFTRNIYRRGRDCFERPIASTPGAYFDLVDRVSDNHNWTFRLVYV